MTTHSIKNQEGMLKEFEALLLSRHQANHKQFLAQKEVLQDYGVEAFGRYVRSTRQNLQLTAQDLALMTEIPHATLLALEVGLILRSDIKSIWIESLANVFDCELTILTSILQQTDKPTPPTKPSASFLGLWLSNLNLWIKKMLDLLSVALDIKFAWALGTVCVLLVFMNPANEVSQAPIPASPASQTSPQKLQMPDAGVLEEINSSPSSDSTAHTINLKCIQVKPALKSSNLDPC